MIRAFSEHIIGMADRTVGSESALSIECRIAMLKYGRSRSRALWTLAPSL